VVEWLQVLQCLPSKHETLSSNSTPTKKKKRKKENLKRISLGFSPTGEMMNHNIYTSLILVFIAKLFFKNDCCLLFF
jgi:hypothetical protein